MSKSTLSESTQKRLLQLAHLSQYEDEVLTEMKKNTKNSLVEKYEKPEKRGSAHTSKHEKSETPEEEREEHKKQGSSKKPAKEESKSPGYRKMKMSGERGQKDSQHARNSNKLTEADFDLDNELPEAPMGEIPDEELETDEDLEGEGDFESDEDFGAGEDSITLDKNELELGLADILSKSSGKNVKVTLDIGSGSGDLELGPEGDMDMDEESGMEHEEPDEDNVLGGEEDEELEGLEDEELEGEEEGEEEEPKLESKKAKKASQLVFEAVMAKLAKKAGVSLGSTSKKKKLNEKLVWDPKKNEFVSAKRQEKDFSPGKIDPLSKSRENAPQKIDPQAAFDRPQPGQGTGRRPLTPQERISRNLPSAEKELGRRSSSNPENKGYFDALQIVEKMPKRYQRLVYKPLMSPENRNIKHLQLAKLIYILTNQLAMKDYRFFEQDSQEENTMMQVGKIALKYGWDNKTKQIAEVLTKIIYKDLHDIEIKRRYFSENRRRKKLNLKIQESKKK